MNEVISFTTRRTIEQDAARAEAQAVALEAQKAAADEALKAALSEAQSQMLEGLESVRKLILAGRLEGVVLMGRDPTTDLFHSQVLLPVAGVPRHKLYGYVGMLEGLRLELLDNAMMAACVQEDGTILDPYVEDNFEEWPE